MADCGASGSALDQAARVVLGNASFAGGSQQQAAKQAATVLGHVLQAGGGGSSFVANQRIMPMVASDQIVLPHLSSVSTLQSVPLPAANALAMDQHSHHFLSAPQMHSQRHVQQSSPAFLAHTSHHILHQHAMQMAVAQQQQQQHMMMTMMHQQNSLRIRQAQIDQLRHAQSQVTPVMLSSSTSQDFDEPLVRGHEGFVQGATIEDLAAAWAQAEADYDEIDAAVNLAAAVNDYDYYHEGMSSVLPTYDFLNTVDSSIAPKQNWMDQGKRVFEAGDLKQAIHAFEMELQLNNPDNAAAWRLLGKCHAENDQDREAIVCLEHAVDRDPYCPEASLALGVSYVNELNHNKALQSLKAWITHNPKFAALDLQASNVNDVYGKAGHVAVDNPTEAAFEEVQRLLLRALQIDSSSPDVLEALGVVYNVSRDYEAAIDAFQKAIAVNPNNYQLYNRLGATFANCNQSEKALPAYHTALQLKPKYARAWLNLAISHSNLHNYKEAARCYLQTLSLNPAATHCWSYLRIALSCHEQWDLIPFTTAMDLKAFAEHFDFVLYE